MQHPKQAPRHHPAHADRKSNNYEEITAQLTENSEGEHREERYHERKHAAKMSKDEEIKHYAMKEELARESLKHYEAGKAAAIVVDVDHEKIHKHHNKNEKAH